MCSKKIRIKSRKKNNSIGITAYLKGLKMCDAGDDDGYNDNYQPGPFLDTFTISDFRQVTSRF